MPPILEALAKDLPFSYPEPDERNSGILVGAIPKLYQARLRTVLSSAMDVSCMAAVVGSPGTGKTQLIRNLARRVNADRDATVAVDIFRPGDQSLREEQLIDELLTCPAISALASRHGLVLDSQKLTSKQDKIRMFETLHRERIGFCLAVDNVDEHLRQQVSSLPSAERIQKTKEFLGVFRLLLSSVPGLLVVFALTTDVYSDVFQPAVGDDLTLRRRFVTINDNAGDLLKLDSFSEPEAREMVSSFLAEWDGRNGIRRPEPGECASDQGNLFPFTSGAVGVFLKAGGYPGLIAAGCRYSILVAREEGSGADAQSDPVIDKEFAAQIVNRFHNLFPRFAAVKEEMKSTAGSTAIQQIQDEAIALVRSRFGTLGETNVRNAVKAYLTALGPEYQVRDSDGPTLHFLFRNKKVGCLVGATEWLPPIEGRQLADEVKGGDIDFVLFVRLGVESGTDLKFNLLSRGLTYHEWFLDYLRGHDYNPVVTHLDVPEEAAWGVAAVSDSVPPEHRRSAVARMDQVIGLNAKVQDLVQRRPGQLSAEPPDRDYIP